MKTKKFRGGYDTFVKMNNKLSFTAKIFMALLLVLVICVSAVTPAFAKGNIDFEDNYTVAPKVINIVYDDSGSMVNGDNPDPSKGFINRWAQAKYSLETFIGMLNEDDTLNIYTMSSKGKKTRSVPGNDKKKQVKRIHNNFKTGDFDVQTPIKTVDGAYNGLTKYSKSNDRWLVVITDGAFDGFTSTQLKSKLNSYGKKLGGKLIYLPISAPNVTGKNFTTLDRNKSIRSNILKAVKQIYKERDQIDSGFDSGSKTISVPTNNLSMKKIVLFVQGKNTKVDSVSAGRISSDISVRYTEPKNAVKYSNSEKTFKGHEGSIKTDKDLTGSVITIEPDGDDKSISGSDGKIIVTFDKNADISEKIAYYEPAVQLAFRLTDSKGNMALSSDNMGSRDGFKTISSGKYTLKADIVNVAPDSNSKKNGTLDDDVHLSDNKLVSPVKLDIEINGGSYSLGELQNGVELNLENGADLKSTKASASIMNGKYAVSTDAFMNLFKNQLIIKRTYTLKVNFSKAKKDSLPNFKFKKSDFILSRLGVSDKKEDMLKATVTCYDDSGKKVPITDDVWQQVKAAYESGGESNNASFIVTRRLGDKKTNIDYSDISCFAVEDGNGVFYVNPRCVKNKKQEYDKKKTTHQKFNDKNVMNTIQAEISLPNVSNDLAYSTTATPVAEKSGEYSVALSMWWTIGIILLALDLLGWINRGRLPFHKNSEYKKGDTKELRYDDYYQQHRFVQAKKKSGVKLQIKPDGKDYFRELVSFAVPFIHIAVLILLSGLKFNIFLIIIGVAFELVLIIPAWLPQKGNIYIPACSVTLKIQGTSPFFLFSNRYNVKLLNKKDDFKGINGKNTANTEVDRRNKYLKIGGKSIEKWFAKDAPKNKIVDLEKGISLAGMISTTKFISVSNIKFKAEKRGKKK